MSLTADSSNMFVYSWRPHYLPQHINLSLSEPGNEFPENCVRNVEVQRSVGLPGALQVEQFQQRVSPVFHQRGRAPQSELYPSAHQQQELQLLLEQLQTAVVEAAERGPVSSANSVSTQISAGDRTISPTVCAIPRLDVRASMPAKLVSAEKQSSGNNLQEPILPKLSLSGNHVPSASSHNVDDIPVSLLEVSPSSYSSDSFGVRSRRLTSGSKELDDILVWNEFNELFKNASLSDSLDENDSGVSRIVGREATKSLKLPKKSPPSNYLCDLCLKPNHFIKDCPQARTRENSLTPYQGKKRCFGEFRCSTCKREWKSGNSWANMTQDCIKCKIGVYPCKQRSLEKADETAAMLRLMSGKESPKEDDNRSLVHPQHLCQKCQLLGFYCRRTC